MAFSWGHWLCILGGLIDIMFHIYLFFLFWRLSRPTLVALSDKKEQKRERVCSNASCTRYIRGFRKGKLRDSVYNRDWDHDEKWG
jgi:hypothetical protein